MSSTPSIRNILDFGAWETFEIILLNNPPFLFPVIFSIALGILLIGYNLFWKPFDRFVDLTDMGFGSVKHSKKTCYKTEDGKRDAINALIQTRKLEDVPPAYANGWFAVLESNELTKQEVKEIHVLGLNLVAWRGKSGNVYIADAYCPHLGAHLGVGGKVQGECIQCPFHGWSFDGSDGHLAEIPYSESTLDMVKIRMHETVEGNGIIYLWYHAEGDKPSWLPPIFPEIDTKFHYCGKAEFLVANHVMDIMENLADTTHLNVVHQGLAHGAGDKGRSRWDFLKHNWSEMTMQVSEVQNENHIAIMKSQMTFILFRKFHLFPTNLTLKEIGPGIVLGNFDRGFARVFFLITITPLSPFRQRAIHRVFTDNVLLKILGGKLISLATVSHFQRDIKIWNRKTYIRNPLLTKEERGIKQFRQWYSQFYSKSSLRNYFTKNENGNPLAF